jgi:hypothetical protein
MDIKQAQTGKTLAMLHFTCLITVPHDGETTKVSKTPNAKNPEPPNPSAACNLINQPRSTNPSQSSPANHRRPIIAGQSTRPRQK